MVAGQCADSDKPLMWIFVALKSSCEPQWCLSAARDLKLRWAAFLRGFDADPEVVLEALTEWCIQRHDDPDDCLISLAIKLFSAGNNTPEHLLKAREIKLSGDDIPLSRLGTSAPLDGGPAATNPAGVGRLDVGHVEVPVSITAMCPAPGVRERTLYLACVEAFGHPLQTLLLELRLNAVRRALSCTSSEHTVTTIASRFGFWHFGNFSAEYKRQFGELPSATLAKTLGTGQALVTRPH